MTGLIPVGIGMISIAKVIRKYLNLCVDHAIFSFLCLCQTITMISKLYINNYTFSLDSKVPNYIYSENSLILSIDVTKMQFNHSCVLCNTMIFNKGICYYWITFDLLKKGKVRVLCDECHNKIFIILSAKLKL